MATSPDPTASRGRARETLAIAVWGAFLSAAIYLAVAAWKHFGRGGFVPMSRDVAWMSPLSYVIFLVVPALPLALIASLMSRQTSLRISTWLTVFLTILAVFLPVTAIHRAAAAVLAAGGAVFAARLVAASPDRWVQRIRWSRRLLLGALVVAAIGIQGWRTLASKREYAALPPLAADAAPNVLLIILDTVRASELGLYGYPRSTTPNIDAFASGGVTFDAAMSTSPWTLPSHASMMTGQYAGRLSTGFSAPLDASEPTLAEAFRARGYETAGFIANQHYTAWDSGIERGFLSYYDYPRSFVQMLKSSWYGQSYLANRLYRAQSRDEVKKALAAFELYVLPKPEGDENTAAILTDRFLDWHAARPSRPFFAFLNFYDAHGPYRPPLALRRKFAPKPKAQDLYDAELSYLDGELGRLFRSLEERGGLRNTLVIVTADHGEQFGEHKLTGHGNSVYLPLLHVPLVMRFDGRLPAGVRRSRTVSLRDLAATIASLSGLDSTVRFPGRSLSALWQSPEDSTAPRSAAIAELYGTGDLSSRAPLHRSRQFALLDDDWHFIWRAPDARELFAYRSDSEELLNHADDSRGGAIADSLHGRLSRLVVADTLRATRPPAH